MTKFLCCCHKEAAENLKDAEQYLDRLTWVADPLAIQAWTQEIAHAKATRLVDLAIMDIYGACAMSGTAAPGDSLALPDKPLMQKSAKLLWLEMALMVEERQWVITVVHTSIFDTSLRIDIQQHVWHLSCNPCGDEHQKIEKLHTSLAPLLIELSWLQVSMGVFQCAMTLPLDPNIATWWATTWWWTRAIWSKSKSWCRGPVVSLGCCCSRSWWNTCADCAAMALMQSILTPYIFSGPPGWRSNSLFAVQPECISLGWWHRTWPSKTTSQSPTSSVMGTHFLEIISLFRCHLQGPPERGQNLY